MINLSPNRLILILSAVITSLDASAAVPEDSDSLSGLIEKAPSAARENRSASAGDPHSSKDIKAGSDTDRDSSQQSKYCILSTETDPRGFEIVNDGNIVTELRYLGSYNFTGEPLRGYVSNVTVLTIPAAQALKQAARRVTADGYRIKIYDAYRPQSAVDSFVEWAKDKNRTEMKNDFYPDIRKDDIFRLGYVAKRSGHSRGSTVDLTLITMDGKEADMGGTFDYFGKVSHFEHKGLSKEAAKNRRYLRRIMTEAGFKPISNEWWHFTLKNEPYPKTFFNFPLDEEYIRKARICDQTRN
jgi:D-alanyl-D-alanine dipeptidase